MKTQIEVKRRWTLEARLLAALIHCITPDDEIEIDEAEVEAIKSLEFVPTPRGKFRLRVRPK
jgi:hypothetical protein